MRGTRARGVWSFACIQLNAIAPKSVKTRENYTLIDKRKKKKILSFFIRYCMSEETKVVWAALAYRLNLNFMDSLKGMMIERR